jgi:Peptidase S24-like
MTAEAHSPIYDDLMRFKPDGMSPNAWALSAGVSRTVWADMRRHGNPSRRTLEKLLRAAGSSLAEFEALRVGAHVAAPPASARISDRLSGSWEGAHLPPLPLIAASIGGEWGDSADRVELTDLRTAEIIDRLARPASLASDETAYAVTIVGASMWPRFRPGRCIAVSAKASVAIGDDVLVKLKGPNEAGTVVHALIKELVSSSSAGVQLRQFNPDRTFGVPAAEIASIERVLGELI